MKYKALLALSVAVVATVSTSIPAEALGPPILAVQAYGYDASAGNWRVENHVRLLADLNHDKKVDVVAFGNDGVYVSKGTANGTFTTPVLALPEFGFAAVVGGWRVERHPRLLGDVNGDGNIDIVAFSEKGTIVARGNGAGGFSKGTFELPFFGHNAAAGGWRVESHLRVLADVNNDKRADIIGFGAKGVWVAKGTALGGFTTPALVLTSFGSDPGAGGWTVANHPRLLGDVNGDKKIDIVGFASNGVYVAKGTGIGTFGAPALVLASFGFNPTAGGWTGANHVRLLADVNNDGRSDIVGFGNNGTWASKGTATGTFLAPALATPQFGRNTVAGGWLVEKHPRLLGDTNGDGRIDIVGFGEKGTAVALGNGLGAFAAGTLASTSFGYNVAAGSWRIEKHVRLLGDVNGDGKQDVVGFANKGTYVSLS